MRRPFLSCGLPALAALALTTALLLGRGAHAAPPARPAAAPMATPCAGAWQRKADYPFPVQAPAAAQDGFIYTFDGAGGALSAVKYDPAADHWSALTSPPVGHTFSSAVSDGAYLYLLNG